MKSNDMKRILFIFLLTTALLSQGYGQSRKYFSYFNALQSYYNPAMVGLEGSSARSIVRNQWGGIDGAPKTVYGSVEGDFAQMGGNDSVPSIGRNAIGLSVMYDKHGAFTETELLLNYSNRIRLSEKHHLGLGIGVKYQNTELDGMALTPEQSDDPSLSQYLGGFAEMKFLDFNFGMALRHRQYYVGYAVQNIAAGKISSGDGFYNERPMSHNVQAGYRGKVSEQIGMAGNVLYRVQEDLPYNAEFNVKALFMEHVWIGVGHRVDYSTGLQAGFLMNRVSVGYSYEMATRRQSKMYGSTHEFMASVRLFDHYGKGIFGMW